MTKRRNPPSLARLAHLAAMRAAKERKRLARIAAGWTPEPPHRRRERWLEVSFRDARSGECTGFVRVKSGREAARLAARFLRDWQPTPRGSL